MNPLAYIELAPKGTATASVIWLHGLGASGNDFQPVVPELKLPTQLAVRFIFPHAPEQPVTVNNGYVMPSWYDILAMGTNARSINEEQFAESVANIRFLIEQEMQRGIPAQHIFLAGFSQGGAVAYHAALGYPQQLGGLLTLSTYLPIPQTLPAEALHPNMPVYIMHGSQDGVVPEAMGREALTALTSMGYQPRYSHYPMEHQVCIEQLHDISAWLQEQLAN